jgi:hypothetical protein
MNLHKLAHKHYCGVDLHSRTMYLCIVGRDGAVLLHRNLPCDRDRFLLTIAPYREDLAVAVTARTGRASAKGSRTRACDTASPPTSPSRITTK